MMEWLRKYWWALIIILSLPVGINFILLIPAFTPVVGDNVAWLSFWGSYFGSIISAGTAFAILYIQYQQNNKENNKNRELQINSLEYQKEREQLQLIIKIASRLVTLVNPQELISIYANHGETGKRVEEIENHLKEIERTKQELFLYLGTAKVSDRKLIVSINGIMSDFNSAAFDVKHLIGIFFQCGRKLRIDDFDDETELFKSLSKELQTVIVEYRPTEEYNIGYLDCNKLVHKRVHMILKIQINLSQAVKDFIRTEEERINGKLIN